MKKLTTVLLTTLLAATAALAQSYDMTGGIRLGTDWGITSQVRLAKKTTAELILQSSLQREEILLTALAEQHSPLISRRFNFYAGGGLHKGWNSAPVTEEQVIKDPFGVTLVAGAEFTLLRLNVSWDFKPAVNIIGGEKKVYTQTGVSLRYVIVKKNQWEKNRKKKQREQRREERRENRKGINWEFWKKKDKN
ncbi:MAG: hypothetical protein R2824_22225 [Saprospiraceae bacterium]